MPPSRPTCPRWMTFPGATSGTGTDKTFANGSIYIAEVWIGAPCTLTGIQYLVGSVGGTDKVIVALFDYAGNKLITSDLAGKTVGTLATYDPVPFLTTYSAQRGLHYIGVQANGTTAKLRVITFGPQATAVVAGTFGTIPAITPPSAHSAANGPIAGTY